MQFSELWLRTFVDPRLNSDALAHTLTMAGLEVEASEPAAPAFSGIIVAGVLEVAPHPNADRLRVVQVDAGTGKPLQIVCGAPNVAVGQRVPCALIGAHLPGDFAISKATMRGVESYGMLCSAKELGLSQDAAGLYVLPGDAPIGTDLREYLALDDRMLTLKLTPNRADCFGLLGIARDVAALTGAPLKAPEVGPVTATSDVTFPVTLADAKACGRFAGRVIKGVDANAPTPLWMKQRLERSGLRSISPIVDVTNYVMLERNRPLHAYDLNKLRTGIEVRWARAGEELKLLNGQTVTLDAELVVITDARGPIGLGGIMGGESTEVDSSTVDVFLESAFFPPEAIAGRSRRLGFASDAGHRFERGVDFADNVDGIERATRLILDICGGNAGPTVDTVAQLPSRAAVTLRTARVETLLGVRIEAQRIADILLALGFSFVRAGDDFSVTPPSFRFDITIEEDLIEEIARIDGYDKIPAKPPRARLAALPARETRRPLDVLKRLLATRDYQEVITFSFVPKEWERDFAGNAAPVPLLNPIASQLAVMRSSLIGSLVDVLRTNLNRKSERVRIFEAGRRFLRAATDENAQPPALSGLAYGNAAREQWGEPKRPVDYFDVKGEIEALLAPRTVRTEAAKHPALHPGRSARVLLDGAPIGWLGELHPRWLKQYELPQAPVVFELDLAPLLVAAPIHARGISKFPAVRRDIALIVDENVSAQSILETLREAAPPFVGEIQLFDVYRGQNLPVGKKSLAILVLMQDTQRTLTDAEVDAAQAVMVSRAQERFRASLRH